MKDPNLLLQVARGELSLKLLVCDLNRLALVHVDLRHFLRRRAEEANVLAGCKVELVQLLGVSRANLLRLDLVLRDALSNRLRRAAPCFARSSSGSTAFLAPFGLWVVKAFASDVLCRTRWGCLSGIGSCMV